MKNLTTKIKEKYGEKTYRKICAVAGTIVCVVCFAIGYKCGVKTMYKSLLKNFVAYDATKGIMSVFVPGSI